MEINELMIGDWVLVNGTPMQIQSIDSIDDEIYAGDELYCLVVDRVHSEDKIEPIPLTAEILEKNGWKREFDKVDYMVKYDLAKEGKHCWKMWAINEHNLDIQRQDEKLDMYNLKVQKVCMPCDFVHELQHALRLCGIDKEIVI